MTATNSHGVETALLNFGLGVRFPGLFLEAHGVNEASPPLHQSTTTLLIAIKHIHKTYPKHIHSIFSMVVSQKI